MIHFQSVRELAHQVRTRAISAVELATCYMQQIERINPFINAVAQVDSERIVNEARLLDDELSKGIIRGPFHGVPISIKDNLMTKGIVSTGGSFAYANFIPDRDATVVKRLREAGAIILGKTNLPDFALAWETESSAYGRTNNPYRLSCTPGGSSGGEAALIAAGGSAMGIGTDSGGSIRLPAHYCGIAGLRPSRGLIPSTGHIPPEEGYPILGVFAAMNAIGPMARYVDDLIYTLPILIGGDGIDPYADNVSVCHHHDRALSGLRVAMYPSESEGEIDPEIQQSLYDTARMLQERGCLVGKKAPPQIETACALYCAIVGADGGEGVRNLFHELNYPTIPYAIEKSISHMEKQPTLRKYLDAVIQWDLFRIKMNEFMQSFDVILCPVANHTALPHGQMFTDDDRFIKEKYLIPYSLMGWPAAVVRTGQSSDGLPIGIQVISKHGYDYLVLQIAQLIEQQMGGWQVPKL